MTKDELKQLCADNDINHRNMDGKALRALRLKLDITQEQMAQKLFMTKEHYGLCERGKRDVSPRTNALALILTQSGNH